MCRDSAGHCPPATGHCSHMGPPVSLPSARPSPPASGFGEEVSSELLSAPPALPPRTFSLSSMSLKVSLLVASASRFGVAAPPPAACSFACAFGSFVSSISSPSEKCVNRNQQRHERRRVESREQVVGHDAQAAAQTFEPAHGVRLPYVERAERDEARDDRPPPSAPRHEQEGDQLPRHLVHDDRARVFFPQKFFRARRRPRPSERDDEDD